MSAPDGELPEEAYAAALASIAYIRPPELLSRLQGRLPSKAWSDLLAGRGRTSPSGGDQGPTVRRRMAQETDVPAVWTRHDQAGVRVVVLGHTGYPAALADDPNPPAVLFARGDLGLLEPGGRRPAVAIVGTRRCTPYGREVARSLGAALAAEGVCVVSGLARGIDGAAHRGALAGGTAAPIGVVGSGLDTPYPSEHRDLWEDIARTGLLVSEAACGGIPAPWRFPFRNRIIAALCDVLVVVESHATGGAMHTVEAAVERGRTVLAVPGSVRSPASDGCNRLLHDGHGPARDTEDVLVALGLGTGAPSPRAVEVSVTGDDAAVLASLDWTPTTVDAVIRRSGLPLPQVALALYRLDDAGLAQESEGWWQRRSS